MINVCIRRFGEPERRKLVKRIVNVTRYNRHVLGLTDDTGKTIIVRNVRDWYRIGPKVSGVCETWGLVTQ